jgi:hypothetical protein
MTDFIEPHSKITVHQQGKVKWTRKIFSSNEWKQNEIIEQI